MAPDLFDVESIFDDVKTGLGTFKVPSLISEADTEAFLCFVYREIDAPHLLELEEDPPRAALKVCARPPDVCGLRAF